MAFGLVDILLAAALGIAIIYAIKLFSGNKDTSAVKKPSALSKTSSSAVAAGSKPPLAVFYGSQSGTAENFAYDFAEEGKNYGFDATVTCLEELDISTLPTYPLAVFVVATFGEGEPTDDTAHFWKFINDDAKDPAEISNTFSVFALGNRQYRYFCAVGKKIDRVLGEMGGERLLPLGIGDDDGTLEEDWEAWRAQFWAAARIKFMNMSAADATATGSTFSSTYDVTMFPEASEQSKNYQKGVAKVARFFSNPAKDVKVDVVKIVESRELRQVPEGLDSTAHIEVDISNTKLSYRTADNLGIYPRNDFKLAGDLAKRLGVSMNNVFTIKSKSNRKAPVPAICSVEDALLYFLDINNALRGKFAGILANYATNEKERSKLTYFANDTKGKEEFHNLRYNWLELLEAFPSVDLPFAHFVELCPRMQPRYYTISSSAKVQPKQIAVTCSRLYGDKPDNREFVGVCSNQLCRSVSDDKNKELVAFVRDSSFRLPVRAGTPIIMIGPGTGIAPFRAFIQEFYTRKENKFGETVLYFGCRNSDKDYIYKEELEKAVADGVLSELNLALSRQPGQPKVYVQDLIKANGQKTWELLNKGAYVFVCGATAMGNEVRSIMCELGHLYGGLTPAASEAYIDKMTLQNKYVQELWSA